MIPRKGCYVLAIVLLPALLESKIEINKFKQTSSNDEMDIKRIIG